MRACAKTILFGEHAAVYGHPVIAVPVRSIWTEASATISEKTSMDSESERTLLLSELLKQRFGIDFKMQVDSRIPRKMGFGSSAAFCIACIRELVRLTGKDMDILELADECERIFHKNPSGVDTAVIHHEKPIYFRNRVSEPLVMRKRMTLVIAGCKGERPPTSEVVGKVWEKLQEEGMDIVGEIGHIAENARSAVEDADIERIGLLMDKNQDLLRRLGVSSDENEAVVAAAKKAGAYGAKISGAGMGGNVIISTADPDEMIRQILPLAQYAYKETI